MYLLLENLNKYNFLHNYTTYVPAEFVDHYVMWMWFSYVLSLNDP